MTDSPTRSIPWLRVFVEGVVIVGSILLAFGIDAWWDGQQERREEQEALAGLQSEFEANLTQANEVIERHLQGRRLMESLVDLEEEEIRALPQSTLSEIATAACNPWTFDAILGSTEALIGAGKLGVLRSRELREALTSFVNLVADAAEDGEYVGWGAERLWIAEIDLGGPWTDPDQDVRLGGEPLESASFIPRASAEDLLRMREDPRFMGLVSRCHINVGFYVGEIEEVRDQARRVLGLIAAPR